MRIEVAAIVAIALSTAWAQPVRAQPAAQPQLDSRACEQLKRMSDFLSSTKSFRVDAQSSLEALLESGQKIQYNASSRVALSRPYLRSARIGPSAEILFLYDGQNYMVYDRVKGLYAMAAAPQSLDQALTDARERLDLQAPGTDLLYSNPGQGLIEDVTLLQYIGLETIDGIRTHHIAARKPGVDWELWIEDSPTPLPRKYVITTTSLPQSPEFEVHLFNWNLSPTFEKGLFTFQPPPGASRVEFFEQRQAPVPGRVPGSGAPTKGGQP